MLKILVLIVFSAIFSFAKDMPIQQKLEIKIPLRQNYVLEFPFKIEVKKSPFYAKRIKEENENEKKKVIVPKIVRPNANGEVIVPIEKKAIKTKSQKKSFTLSNSDNIIELFARKEGNTEIIVWGYSEFPIMIKIVVEENTNINDNFLRFVDYKVDQKKAIKYESGSHEKVLLRLLKSLTNNKVPTGFKTEIETLDYQKDGLYYQLDKRIVGYNYVAESWIIENKEDRVVNLYDEMFAEKDIFLVSIENTKINKDESTRLFIIRGM